MNINDTDSTSIPQNEGVKRGSRGVVVLDKGVVELKEFLQERNIRVVTPPPELSMMDFICKVLPMRILITDDPGYFLAKAFQYEFGIISISKSLLGSPDHAARLISRAATGYGLWSRRQDFMVTIDSAGESKIQDMELHHPHSHDCPKD